MQIWNAPIEQHVQHTVWCQSKSLNCQNYAIAMKKEEVVIVLLAIGECQSVFSDIYSWLIYPPPGFLCINLMYCFVLEFTPKIVLRWTSIVKINHTTIPSSCHNFNSENWATSLYFWLDVDKFRLKTPQHSRNEKLLCYRKSQELNSGLQWHQTVINMGWMHFSICAIQLNILSYQVVISV